MGLPYPREVETGELRPRPPAPIATFDVARAIDESIVARGTHVDVLGVPCDAGDAARAEALAARWRDALTRHFQARVQAPRVDTWQRFVDSARPQLEGHTDASDSVLEVLRLTVDNF